MKNRIKYIAIYAIVAGSLFICQDVSAGPPPPPPPPPSVPIDGGVSLLAAAGVAYGVKKYRDSRKK
jgi:hypothetical protein